MYKPLNNLQAHAPIPNFYENLFFFVFLFFFGISHILLSFSSQFHCFVFFLKKKRRCTVRICDPSMSVFRKLEQKMELIEFKWGNADSQVWVVLLLPVFVATSNIWLKFWHEKIIVSLIIFSDLVSFSSFILQLLFSTEVYSSSNAPFSVNKRERSFFGY